MEGERIVARAVLAVACADATMAAGACDAFLASVDHTTGNLGRANQALIGAVVCDACGAQLDTARRTALGQTLHSLSRSFRIVDLKHGDPHAITNNHWAVSHAGAAVAALAAQSLSTGEAGRTEELAEDVVWAIGRVKPFLMHHGDYGLYHEGLGYHMYPAAFWLPCLLAVRNRLGLDWLTEFPNLRRAAAALYASVATRRQGNRVGVKLSWNDDDTLWCDRNTSALLLTIAPSEQVGALRWMYDRLNGVLGEQRFNPDHAGLFFSFVFYPYDVTPQDPNTALPRHIVDGRQGLCLLRNRYRDADDAILGCYARATHVGGHAQDDAGSIRFMALGHDWIVGGGQARGHAEWQSLVVPADGTRPKKPLDHGAVIWDEPSDTGGVFGMDLRQTSRAYAERWVAVDYSGAAGVDATLALLDLVDDHLGRAWLWNLSYASELTCAIHADNAGFDLTAADGAFLTARFLAARPDAVALQRMPDARRTFQAGPTHVYPGGPFVQARFSAREHLGIYVVMAVGRAARPTIVAGAGLTARVNAWEWSRPFGAAIPSSFHPGFSGTLCRYPKGEKT